LPKNNLQASSFGQLFQDECKACHSSNFNLKQEIHIRQIRYILIFDNSPIFQIFSNSVSVGLKYYREHENVHKLKFSQETEKFSKLFNDIFDSLNRRFPAEGIRRNSADLKVIIFI